MDFDPDERDFLPEIKYTPMAKPKSSFQPPVKTKKKSAVAEAPFFRMSENKYLKKKNEPVPRNEKLSPAKQIRIPSTMVDKGSRHNPAPTVQHNKQEKKRQFNWKKISKEKVSSSGTRQSLKKGTVLQRMKNMETWVKENKSPHYGDGSQNVRKRKLSESSPESTLDDSDADPDYNLAKEKSLSDSESEINEKICKSAKKKLKLSLQPPSENRSNPQHSQLPNPISISCGSSEMAISACKICGVLVKDIKEHHKTVHLVDLKTFKCEECGKGFNENQTLSDHKMNVHLKLRSYKCRHGCEMTYNDRSSRNQHEKRKHGDQVNKPIYCGSSELARSELSLTMGSRESSPIAGLHPQHHQQPVRQGQFVVRQQSQKVHPEALTPATPDQIITPPSETGSSLLENETPLSCVRCGRGFINFGALLNHSKACLKTYTCNVCKVNFKKLKYLKLHVKVKHVVGQIPCEHCEMKFKSQPKLNRHLKSHLNPLAKCNICEKVFKNNNVLKVHKSKVHKKKEQSKSVKMWVCNLCQKVYQSDRGLRAHKVIHKKFADQNQENVENNFEEEDEELGMVEENMEEAVKVDSSNIVITDVVDYIVL